MERLDLILHAHNLHLLLPQNLIHILHCQLHWLRKRALQAAANTCPLLPAHYLAKVVQAQQPVDALWSTVVFDARFDETLSPNLQSGFLTNFTNCRGFGGFTVGDKSTG